MQEKREKVQMQDWEENENKNASYIKLLCWLVLIVSCVILNMIFGSIGYFILIIAAIIRFYKWMMRE